MVRRLSAVFYIAFSFLIEELANNFQFVLYSSFTRQLLILLLVLQVRYLGLIENVRVRRAGFANRQVFGRFLQRYDFNFSTHRVVLRVLGFCSAFIHSFVVHSSRLMKLIGTSYVPKIFLKELTFITPWWALVQVRFREY